MRDQEEAPKCGKTNLEDKEENSKKTHQTQEFCLLQILTG